MKNLHSNIIVISMPYRSDLPMSSCVNKEVSVFNMKLEKCLKSFNDVSLIKTKCCKGNFTWYGVHLNSLGKVNVVSQIMKCIHTMINKEIRAPIKLDWRTEHDTADSEITEPGSTHAPPTLEANTLDMPVDGDVTGMGPDYVSTASPVSPESRVNTFDKHTSRKPITKSLDFLWQD
jgi:hypothetical protein